MSAAKKLEMFPDELFLQTALKDGRATLQEVSMKAIGKPDTSLQAREQHLDMNHVHMLHEILRQQGKLGPVVIFREMVKGKVRLHLADGFHRHEVYRREKLEAIPAFVIDGTYQEAVEFATMCNRRLCLPRRSEDTRKAVLMLLAEEKWFRRGDKLISEHVGTHPLSVKKLRLEYCALHEIPVPDWILDRNEKQRTYGTPNCRKPKIYTRKNGVRGHYESKVFGVRVHAVTEQGSREKAEQIIEDRSNCDGLLRDFGGAMATRGVLVSAKGSSFGGYNVFTGQGFIAVICRFDKPKALAQSIGELMLASVDFPNNKRMVVICNTTYLPDKQAASARTLGFEFLTPDELIASLKEQG